MSRIRIFSAICTVIVFAMAADRLILWREVNQSDRLDAVGGVEEYRRQRREHLDRLFSKNSAVAPEFRERDAEEIERQILTIDREETGEIGGEASVIRFLPVD